MALSYELTNIENWEDVCYLPAEEGESDDDRKMSAVTHSLIFATIGVGLPKITAKNIDKFYLRLRQVERVYGAFMVDGDGQHRLFTLDDLRAHIGLTTNASVKTDAKFRRGLTDQLKRGAEDALRLAKRREQQEAERAVQDEEGDQN